MDINHRFIPLSLEHCKHLDVVRYKGARVLLLRAFYVETRIKNSGALLPPLTRKFSLSLSLALALSLSRPRFIWQEKIKTGLKMSSRAFRSFCLVHFGPTLASTVVRLAVHGTAV
jgi:hypothetical protein